MAENNGHAISFMRHLRCASPATLATIILSHLYLLLRYL